MTDKPKRKRSEIVKPAYNKRALRWLMLLYSFFLLPYLVDIWYLIPVFIALSLATGILWVGSYLVRALSQVDESLLTKITALLISVISVLVMCAVLVICAIIGCIIFVIWLYPHISFLHPIMNYLAPISGFMMLLEVILLPALCFSFTLELIETMPKVVRKNKQKNVAVESVEYEPKTKADIPRELLAESESAEQAQK
jgi:hypothetical protein